MKSGITIEDWMKAEVSMHEGKPIPDGYITVSQFAQARTPPISYSRACGILNQLCNSGLSAKEFWIKNGKRIVIYRLKNEQTRKGAKAS